MFCFGYKMRCIAIFLFFFLPLLPVLASPLENRGIELVPAYRNPTYRPNATKALLHAYHRYGIKSLIGPYHRNENNVLVERHNDGASTAVFADDYMNDLFYTCPVLIGTPPQVLTMNFDTGSADTWVRSTALSERWQSNNATVFDPARSSSFQNMSESTFFVSYGDSSWVNGKVGTDILRIGNIAIENQAIELATALASVFKTMPTMQGFLGLSFSTLNKAKPHPVLTPVENMALQQDIPADHQLFTAYLGSYKDAKDPDMGRSFYTFGGINQALVPPGEEPRYTSVNDTGGRWKISSPSVVVNGQAVDLPHNEALVDTGTTLIFVTEEVCRVFYAQIPGALFSEADGQWIFPTETPIDLLPTFSVAVGDSQVVINKEHFPFAPSGQENMTVGAIQSRIGLSFDILGIPFLQSVYAIFDVGRRRFGVVNRFDPTPNGPA
ncbi:hypothetical protein PV08_07877 [Exophiala spinifera]|uniref:Peptidase A1 domain-containing protein n=1 Tax=Exophiala spinifera TaxID=91928 RepID=A0A0D2B8W1_9EURO|nr:uncharacterized protein PV08_07877 [Exophiala spinifera]KIW15090.1 hypothetical protein PV08_07877 [Exophiala spinifera]